MVPDQTCYFGHYKLWTVPFSAFSPQVFYTITNIVIRVLNFIGCKYPSSIYRKAKDSVLNWKKEEPKGNGAVQQKIESNFLDKQFGAVLYIFITPVN